MKKRKQNSGNPLVQQVRSMAADPAFARYLQQLLLELCSVDTTPSPEIVRMRDAEDRCFRVLERELAKVPIPGARTERKPINPKIAEHPHYSLLHFTKTAARPEGLSPEQVYAERGNLLFVAPGQSSVRRGASIALNAHLDVVAPYLPPRARRGVVYGRGACDDKGPLVSIVGALALLGRALAKANTALNQNVLAMFVVEEETGGNGSLSLAIDRDLKRLYDSVLVCECTNLKVHPANRGAVWYKATLRPPPGVSPLEMFAFINEAMEQEGTAIRAESRHKLFPQRPVQTCHGIIGPYGEHPSRICGEASFTIDFPRTITPELHALVVDRLESGLAGYVGAYGDKTKVTDPATGQPMVRRHYEIRKAARKLSVTIHGAAGHMGAIRERDGAITKMAHLLRSLVASRERLDRLARGPVRFSLTGKQEAEGQLVLEGGQGFVPTHHMPEVMARLRAAVERGAETYLRRIGRSEPGPAVATIVYEKLHNAAYDGDPDSASVRNAVAAAKLCGLWKDEPVLGWTVSCDARLFATEYPGMEVLTFGPGQLAYAHSDHEQITIEEVRAAAEFLAVFLLRQTGTVGQTSTTP